MAKSTPATLALQKAGVAFTLHEYGYDLSAPHIGMQAAGALGIEPVRLMKTLMARAGEAPRFLHPLEESIARGITPAKELPEKFHAEWAAPSIRFTRNMPISSVRLSIELVRYGC